MNLRVSFHLQVQVQRVNSYQMSFRQLFEIDADYHFNFKTSANGLLLVMQYPSDQLVALKASGARYAQLKTQNLSWESHLKSR